MGLSPRHALMTWVWVLIRWSPVTNLSRQATRILAAWYLLRQDVSSYPTTNFDAFRTDDDSVNQHIDVQADHDRIVREIGAASIVLLKNNKGALPLRKPRSLVLIGSDAGPGHVGPNQFPDQGGLDGVLFMGWGSGSANLTYLITVRTLAWSWALTSLTPFSLMKRSKGAREKTTRVSFGFSTILTLLGPVISQGKRAPLLFSLPLTQERPTSQLMVMRAIGASLYDGRCRPVLLRTWL